METHLKVTLTQCRKNKPLISLCNWHLLDTDMRPEQLRTLALILNTVASASEARTIKSKRSSTLSMSFSLGDGHE